MDLLDAMAHFHDDIILVVSDARCSCDRHAGNDLFDKNHAAAPFVAGQMAHVKPEIDLLEIAVERNRNALDSRVKKHQAEDAEVSCALVGIDHGAGRRQWFEHFACDLKIEHGEMPPLGGKKRSRAVHSPQYGFFSTATRILSRPQLCRESA